MTLVPSRILASILCLAAAGAGEPGGGADAPLVAEVLGSEVRTRDPGEVQYLIVGKLLDEYAAERGIEASEGDIDAYIEGMRRAVERGREEDQARREAIARELESQTLSDAERESLASELDTLKQILAADQTATGDDASMREARRELARAFVLQWKINQALYRHYGGRIGYQQGGPEPLDAYRRFLEERQAQGAFEFLDQDTEAQFWAYYVTDSLHSFYPSGSEEEARAFEIPWWLQEEAREVP